MTAVAINNSAVSDEQHVIDVIVLAFSADPAARRMFPDPTQYLRHFPKFVKAFGGKAFRHGTAYHIDGFLGAALWLPPDVHPDEEPLAVLIEATVAKPVRQEVFAVIEQMASHHPREPHWYLPLIGVDPIQQGKGLGSALMGHALIRCDREKKLAYLESSNAKNIPLYEREGFERIGHHSGWHVAAALSNGTGPTITEYWKIAEGVFRRMGRRHHSDPPSPPDPGGGTLVASEAQG